jgi:putative ABC transport system permease protein
MLSHYLKIAFRGIVKDKLFSLINIFGLSMGVAACVLILLYAQHELSFDRMHPNSGRIFRLVEVQQTDQRSTRHVGSTSGNAASMLAHDFPEVEQTTHLLTRQVAGRVTVQHGENRFYEGRYMYAEPSLFTIFAFPFIHGDPNTALEQPKSVVLTESAAKKYFGEENPAGQILNVERGGDFMVTGVIKDPPTNSHLSFSMLFSLATLESNERWKRWIESWASSDVITYVKLKEGASYEQLNTRIPPWLNTVRTTTPGNQRSFYLQPLHDIHFSSAAIELDENAGKSDIATLYAFLAIALFILGIASINYMNLATSRSLQRAKEVGVRKIFGARASQLVARFFAESVALSFLALLAGFGLVELLLPGFKTLSGKNLGLDVMGNPTTLGGILLIGLVIGIVSGTYPALYLSHLAPAAMLKGSFKASSRGIRLRQALVISQFGLSILLIISTMVVSAQLSFIRNKGLGFNKEHLVVVDINNGNVRKNFRSIMTEFASVPSVKAISTSSRVPGDWKDIAQIEARSTASSSGLHKMNFVAIDGKFLETFEIKLVSGRNISTDLMADSTAVLLNETAAAMLGRSDIIGKEIQIPFSLDGGNKDSVNLNAHVVGVVKDFHFASLHEPIGPMVLGYWSNPIQAIDYFSLRVASDNLPATIEELRKIGERFDPTHPFEYNFLDDKVNDFYRSEERAGLLFTVSATVALVIACLGLFALASFTTTQRTKEFGIRRVLGASVPNILRVVSKEFIALVLIANVIAWPIAYYIMNGWLQSFAYRVGLGIDTFVLAGALAFGVALLAVCSQAIKAAMSNPVEALRYE